MKANELMIGDWVYAPFMTLMSQPKRKTVKVTAELLGNDKALKEISPIPLTEDILKANGWDGEFLIRITNPKYYDCSYNPKCTIDFHLHGNVCVNGPFNYVHELQHALRLCGMNDLADNFKIEEITNKTVYNAVMNALNLYNWAEKPKIELSNKLYADLNLDELDMVDVYMAIEKSLNMEIPDMPNEALKTVGELIEHVENVYNKNLAED